MTDLVTLAADGELRISSLAVAERTGREHEPVLRLIRDNLADFESFGRVSFENGPFETRGGIQRKAFALLNEQQSTLLMTFMRNNEAVKQFKIELVKQFYSMRQALTQPATPRNFAEALELAAAQARAIETANAKIALDAPKVDYVDTFVRNGDVSLFRNVAKRLGMRETDLRDDLLARKWIYVETIERWSKTRQEDIEVHRYSAYSDKARYFYPAPTHDAPKFKGEVMHTLKITPRGAVALAKLYNVDPAAMIPEAVAR